MLLGVGLILSGVAQHRTLLWHTGTGKITRLHIAESRTEVHGVTKSSFTPQVEYTYSVGERTFTGTRLSFLTRTERYKADVDKFLQKHDITLGATRNVFYDPQRPAQSVLVRGFDWGNKGFWIGLAVLLLAIAGGYERFFSGRVSQKQAEAFLAERRAKKDNAPD